jgi:hypothetical protein
MAAAGFIFMALMMWFMIYSQKQDRKYSKLQDEYERKVHGLQTEIDTLTKERERYIELVVEISRIMPLSCNNCIYKNSKIQDHGKEKKEVNDAADYWDDFPQEYK